MTAAEGTYLGIAIQPGYDGGVTPAVNVEDRDAQFKYLLFSQGAVGPNNIIMPLEPEVGGGALMRSVVKMGVNSGGAIEFVPRPETLGLFLLGATGQVATVKNTDPDGCLETHSLDGTTLATGFFQPSAATKLFVTGSATANGDVVLSGTVAGAPDTETIALNGVTPVYGVKSFTAITSIVLPTDAGQTCTIGWDDGTYTHTFTLGSDQFDAPYWTLRQAPGNLWGEQLRDVRMNALGLEFAGVNFLRATGGFVGGRPDMVATTNWDALDQVDSGPQFVAPLSYAQLPTGTSMAVLRGSLVSTMAIPMDEQYVLGSYYPQGLDVVSRGFALQLAVKIDSADLYQKMMYDPALGSAWTAEIFKEGRFTLSFGSDTDAATVKRSTVTSDVRPYRLTVTANGGQGDNANVYWSATPIPVRAQRQLVMQVNGVFAASSNGITPITFSLVNRRASYAYVTP